MTTTALWGKPRACKPISIARATDLLPPKEELHSFVRVFGWMGGRVRRDVVLAALAAQGGAELSEAVAHFHHLLAVTVAGKRTFIETDPLQTRALLAEIHTSACAERSGFCHCDCLAPA